jgi:hypothetical protein
VIDLVLLPTCPEPATLPRLVGSANLACMKRPKAANDNSPNAPPMQRYAWDV